MENDALPQYMRIARSIAQRIADGELQEGEKLSGRSKLSSEYNVSPETIRKAVQVLQDRAVVNVREQSGVYVLSAAQARQCLGSFKDGGGLIGKKHQLRQLLEQHPIINSSVYASIDLTENLNARDTVQEHRAIVAAVERHDFSGARWAMTVHLNTSRSSMIQRLDGKVQ